MYCAMGRSVASARSSSSSSSRRSSIARRRLWLQPLLILTGCCLCQAYDPEASITGLYTGPYFDPLTPKNHTAHLDDQAVLPCTVRQLGDKSVSWVRMRDADILTVDRYTFVGDERFESHYSTVKETWNLVIKYVQERDAGLYECQVSTEPKMSQLFSLRVVGVKKIIAQHNSNHFPPTTKGIKACQIIEMTSNSDFSKHKKASKRNFIWVLDVSVKKSGPEAITSTLTIHRVQKEDSGNYTCMPSNLHAASVMLHVLNEEQRAAVSDGRNSANNLVDPKLQLLLILLLFVLIYPTSSIIELSVNTESRQVEDEKVNKDRSTSSNIRYDNSAISKNFNNCSMGNKNIISRILCHLNSCSLEYLLLKSEIEVNEMLQIFKKSYQSFVVQNNEFLQGKYIKDNKTNSDMDLGNNLWVIGKLIELKSNDIIKDMGGRSQLMVLDMKGNSFDANDSYALLTNFIRLNKHTTVIYFCTTISEHLLHSANHFVAKKL
ncbi:unnamed protein product, partial [Meganyctiphanes norvegica]